MPDIHSLDHLCLLSSSLCLSTPFPQPWPTTTMARPTRTSRPSWQRSQVYNNRTLHQFRLRFNIRDTTKVKAIKAIQYSLSPKPIRLNNQQIRVS
jgi:hypothetical protein